MVCSILTFNSSCTAGECGLDYSDGFPPAEDQTKWFREQLSLAKELQKPLFLHERGAHSDFMRHLNEAGILSSSSSSSSSPATPAAAATTSTAIQTTAETLIPCIVHCFTGSVDELKTYIQTGCYIGLTGHVLHRLDSNTLQTWMQIIPPDKVLVETDAPYMGFPGCRGTEKKKKNSRYPNIPAALPQVLRAVATAAGISEVEMARCTVRNVRRLFPRMR